MEQIPEDRPETKNAARYRISMDEQKQRRVMVRGLLAHGVDRERVYAALAASFGMTEDAVDRLIAEVNEDDEKQFVENKKHSKRRQLQRVAEWREKAARKGQFQAVAKLEELTADIEGNRGTAETGVNTALVMAGALAGMLGQMSEERAQRLLAQHAERQAKLLAPTPGARLLGERPAIDAEFVESA